MSIAWSPTCSRSGQRAPEFYEIAGPYVRVVMIGGNPDPAVIGYIDAIEPGPMREDVDLLLLLDQLMRRGFADARSLAPVLQRSPAETTAALDRARSAASGGQQIISPVRGTPRGHPPAYRLSDHAREKLASRVAWIANPDDRDRLVLDWVRVRGRVSSTETADLTGITPAYAGTILTRLADDGLLVGSRPQRMGRGFHYVPGNAEPYDTPSDPGRAGARRPAASSKPQQLPLSANFVCVFARK